MTLEQLNRKIISCKKCKRLVAWRNRTAKEKTRRFSDWKYWGKPLTGFGDKKARLLIIGLAPATHGGNRTGRMFTGDRSGDLLIRTLYKAGLANQPFSIHRDDGLVLRNCFITAICKCAPPENKPLKEEIINCIPYLTNEIRHLKNTKVIIVLGRVAFNVTIKCLRELGELEQENKFVFQHGAYYKINEKKSLICSYHPSQQNTFTGRLTEKMFYDIFKLANKLLKKNEA